MTPDRAGRLYRHLLRLAPRRLRDRHAGDMEAMFLEALGQAAPARGSIVWTSAVWDLLRARLREPFRRRPSVPPLPDERPALMLGTDLKYTFRWLGRQKNSTSLVVAMLALGIAANVVVFSLVNGLFLRPFAIRDADRLVYINETAPKWNLEVVGVNYPDFDHWRNHAKLFDGLGVWDEASFNLSDGSGAERIDGAT